jgi:hypothetical protein
MKRLSFLALLPCALLILSLRSVAAESQSWKLRPGDNIDGIAATLEIPADAIRRHNPGIVETNLQIGQRLKLPLRSYAESHALQEQLAWKNNRIADLENRNSLLEAQIAQTNSRLRWQPLWLWGFWIFLIILSFIGAGAYWLFRETHPPVFEEPHRDRSIRDLKESQIRARSFPYDEHAGDDNGEEWHIPMKRVPHPR